MSAPPTSESPPGQFTEIAPDAASWDDTALIRAYRRAAQTHRTADVDTDPADDPSDPGMPAAPIRPSIVPVPPTPPPRKRARRSLAASAAPVPASAPTPPTSRAKPMHIAAPPPPPPLGTVDPDVEQLLLTWYEAGYRAGLYVARHSQ